MKIKTGLIYLLSLWVVYVSCFQVAEAALLNQHELENTLSHSTNDAHLQAEYDQESIIKELAKKNGLFFFYRSTCPYCKRFAPVVKRFAETYGIVVVPITTDGISLPEFPHSYINQRQSERFHVTVEPALFLVNPYTHQAVAIAYGLVSEAELRKNILDVAMHIGGSVR